MDDTPQELKAYLKNHSDGGITPEQMKELPSVERALKHIDFVKRGGHAIGPHTARLIDACDCIIKAVRNDLITFEELGYTSAAAFIVEVNKLFISLEGTKVTKTQQKLLKKMQIACQGALEDREYFKPSSDHF